jgi:hypothetical protein
MYVHRIRTANSGVEHQRLETMIKQKINVHLDDDSLKMIIDLVAGEMSSQSLSSSSSSSPSSASSSSSSQSSHINIIDMYKDDASFRDLLSKLNKNDKQYFEECWSKCTVFDQTTNTRGSSNMMAVIAKSKIQPGVTVNQKIKFGFLTGHVISRVEFEKHKHARYIRYTESLRALPVGLDRILLVDFDCLGAFINSASSAYKNTLYRNLPLVVKVRMVQSSKWEGVYYFETMEDFVIDKHEEIHTLYVDGLNEAASRDDDEIEANRVSLTQHTDDDNEDDDPSVSLSQL